MINAIIVDDEKSAIVTLKNDLRTYCPEVNVIECFTSTSKALEHVRQTPPDLIFLDINMPVMNGFDFLQSIDLETSPQIIFVTAYTDFAIRAFKVSALDYLLKPIDPDELKAAVQKVATKTVPRAEEHALYRNFQENLSGSQKAKIVLPVNDGYHLVNPEEIIYCRADGAYTEVIMNNDKSFLIAKTLGRTQELMPPEYFERIHQSYLVNLNHIKKFRKGESPVVVMINNDTLKVSRLNKDRLGARLGIR